MSTGAEIAIVLLLTLANGLFAGAEIAVLSVRKTRLEDLAGEGKGGRSASCACGRPRNASSQRFRLASRS